VAACYGLLRQERQVLAGVALGALVLKPQLGSAHAGGATGERQVQAFGASVVTIGVLALAAVVVVGPAGVSAYEQRLNFAASVPVNRELTIAAVAGNLNATRAVEAVIAIWSLVLVYRFRMRRAEWIFVPALVGGLLRQPYLHLDDFLMIGLAAWLYLRTSPQPGWSWAFVLALVIAVEGIPFWGRCQ